MKRAEKLDWRRKDGESVVNKIKYINIVCIVFLLFSACLKKKSSCSSLHIHIHIISRLL